MKVRAGIPAERAYPTLTRAAVMIGVSPSTLGRLPGLQIIRAGRRDHLVPAAEVLRVAQEYRWRPIDEVAFDLVEYAKKHAPEWVDVVAQEVDETTSELYQAAPKPSVEDFVRDAKRLLPADLYQQVAHAVFWEPAAPVTRPAADRHPSNPSDARTLVGAGGARRTTARRTTGGTTSRRPAGKTTARKTTAGKTTAGKTTAGKTTASKKPSVRRTAARKPAKRQGRKRV